MARDNEETENLGMVLGIVKSIKLDAMDSSIRKSLDFMQNSINELSKTISNMQTSISMLPETVPESVVKGMSARLIETMSLYNEANEALITLTLKHLNSSFLSRDAFSSINAEIPSDPSLGDTETNSPS